MGRFEKYANPGVCDVCGKKTDVIVCCSAFGATSYAYCRDCFDGYLEPYSAMVDYISCAGLFPDDINEGYQRLCRHILNGLGISEEKFIEDVKNAQDDFYQFAEEQGLCDDFDFSTDEYMIFNCPECGEPLEVWSEETIKYPKEKWEKSRFERRILIRHCGNCHRDWENEWWTEEGDVGETELKRKFWG